MWIWKCPVSNVTFEYHNEQDARRYLFWHVVGYDFENFHTGPCYARHEVEDDGYECHRWDCKIPYISAWDD